MNFDLHVAHIHTATVTTPAANDRPRVQVRSLQLTRIVPVQGLHSTGHGD